MKLLIILLNCLSQNAEYYNYQNPSWCNPELQRLVNLKKIVHKKYKISASQYDYIEFFNLRKEC